MINPANKSPIDDGVTFISHLWNDHKGFLEELDQDDLDTIWKCVSRKRESKIDFMQIQEMVSIMQNSGAIRSKDEEREFKKRVMDKFNDHNNHEVIQRVMKVTDDRTKNEFKKYLKSIGLKRN